MKKMIALACLGFAFVVSAPAFAGSQQEKMKGCSKEAKGLKGEEYKAFRKKCLSKDYVLKSDAATGAPVATAVTPVKPATSATPATPAAKAPNASVACDAKAAEKKLAGAAKNSFVKKCVADANK